VLLQSQFRPDVAAGRHREKAQLALLLRAAKSAVEAPFQRLPMLAALFLAEAACALCHPAAAMYPAVNKHLLSRAALDLQVNPPSPFLDTTSYAMYTAL
jgi:hypothetical protein